MRFANGLWFVLLAMAAACGDDGSGLPDDTVFVTIVGEGHVELRTWNRKHETEEDANPTYCPDDCQEEWDPFNTEIVLVAVPDPGASFAGWEVTMGDGDENETRFVPSEMLDSSELIEVTATFTSLPACTPTADPAGTPTITNISPATGCAGRTTYIQGTNLANADGSGACVYVGGMLMSGVTGSDTELAVPIPAGFAVGTAVIMVTTLDGTAMSSAPIVDVPPPVAKSIAPNPAAPGATVTLTGTGLDSVDFITVYPTAGGPSMQATIVAQTATTLQFVVPALTSESHAVFVAGPCGSDTLSDFVIMP
jgi:hypothetical protein